MWLAFVLIQAGGEHAFLRTLPGNTAPISVCAELQGSRRLGVSSDLKCGMLLLLMMSFLYNPAALAKVASNLK